MRENKNEVRVYNLLFPVWLLVFLPSWLWLLLIPGNYLIDRLVLRWGVSELEDAPLFCRKNTWKICLAGFASDFIGAGFLLAAGTLLDAGGDALYDVGYGLMFQPFGNIGSFLIMAVAVAISGVAIFFFDRHLLMKAGLAAEMAKSAALKLAIVTAPYLFFFPSGLLYD